MTVLESIRRILAEDAAHPDLTHEVFLRQETVESLMKSGDFVSSARAKSARTVLGLPVQIQDVARDTIVTYRAGRAISSTYL